MTVYSRAAMPARSPLHDPIRVMIVDDAVVVRGLMARWLSTEEDLMVVASLRTGKDAVDQIDNVNPDVILLDVEMPVLDGISALPQLLAKKPDVVVIMASTVTRRNAEISLKALALGAADYIPKPESNNELITSDDFRNHLIDKVRLLGVRRKANIARRQETSLWRAPQQVQARSSAVSRFRAQDASGEPALRPFGTAIPHALVIGASTGGPQALTALLSGLDPAMMAQAPVLVTQHMPPTFTTILAEHISRATGRPAHEGIDGEIIHPGHIYIAPGARHMSVLQRYGVPSIRLDDGPLVNFCRPAVDPLFTSAAHVWGPATVGVILTGMGSDGTGGAADIVAAGGSILAQDEASSVVWGMPGSVANAGLCSAVLPIDAIAVQVNTLFRGRSRERSSL